MIVVVHIPKTGGTSVKSLLAAEFGERLLLEYDDRPLTRGSMARKVRALRSMLRPHPELAGHDCLYGHFLPLKYARVRDARFATWLRHPVQRAMSRYHHYLRASAAGRSRMPPGLEPEQFFRQQSLRNTYAKYLWGFPLARFEFVGITEELELSASMFRHRFGISTAAPTQRLNANPERRGDRYEVEPTLHRLIVQANARDMAIYDQGRRIFESYAQDGH